MSSIHCICKAVTSSLASPDIFSYLLSIAVTFQKGSEMMLGKTLVLSGLFFGAAALAPVAASPITYDVNLTVGSGSVFGNITTDGVFGTLSSADITDFNLTLNGNGASLIIAPPSAVAVISGSHVTATASTLSFDFDGTDGSYLLFQKNLMSGTQYFCSAAGEGTCLDGETVAPQGYKDASATFDPTISGVQVIGTVSAVPLPASLPMFGASLLVLAGLGYGMSRRARAKAMTLKA